MFTEERSILVVQGHPVRCNGQQRVREKLVVGAVKNDIDDKSLTFVVFVYCLYTNEKTLVLAVHRKVLSIFVPVHMGFLLLAVISFLMCLMMGNVLETKGTRDLMDEQTDGGTHSERTGKTGGIPPGTPGGTYHAKCQTGLDVGPGYMSWPITLDVGDMTVRGSIRETLKINTQCNPRENARCNERTTASGTSLGTWSIVGNLPISCGGAQGAGCRTAHHWMSAQTKKAHA